MWLIWYFDFHVAYITTSLSILYCVLFVKMIVDCSISVYSVVQNVDIQACNIGFPHDTTFKIIIIDKIRKLKIKLGEKSHQHRQKSILKKRHRKKSQKSNKNKPKHYDIFSQLVCLCRFCTQYVAFMFMSHLLFEYNKLTYIIDYT